MKTENNESPCLAIVHRYQDRVAVHIGDGSTQYLEAEEARALAKALVECAGSIKYQAFTRSHFATHRVEPTPRYLIRRNAEPVSKSSSEPRGKSATRRRLAELREDEPSNRFTADVLKR
jgi:hypothetical protein